jgi:dihydroorotase-like cyclic amidohydrolase
MRPFDLVVLNGMAVLPGLGPARLDIGVRDGRVAALADSLTGEPAGQVVDAAGRHVLPGAVDSHFHVGIYRPHAEDARSESRSAVAGGVTTLVSYFRTGHHYLNKTGPYRDIFPEVLALSEGNFHCDYAYHVAPMTNAQLDEIPWLVDQGVASFKYYMFYKALTLSADSTKGRDYTMADEYDLGHLYEIMERVAACARQQRRRISVSLHCENPELIRVFIRRVKREGREGLQAYSDGRPPLTERLSIQEAGVLADAAGVSVNLLHLSSREAVEAAVDVRRRHPSMDVVLETTLHHLCLTCENAGGLTAKVNPPIRGHADREALWRAVTSGQIDTVVSDHACCMEEMKQGDTWSALPGFGGTSLLYPTLLTEGVARRGLPLARAVELASTNPARHFGLYPKKGTIAVGSDADFAIVDLSTTRAVTPDSLHSAQDHTPFAGMELTGWPVATVLRGRVVFDAGGPAGERTGRYLARPVPPLAP